MTSKTIKAAALAAFASLAFAASSAMGAEQTVTGGAGDWGFKESFRNYIVSKGNPGAPNGNVIASDGASQNPNNGTFNFTSATGAVDRDAGSGNVELEGSVLFIGSPGGQKNAIQLRITDPRVQWSGNSGTLFLDVLARTSGAPDPYQESRNVAFATLDLTGVTPTGPSTSLSLQSVPMVITQAGTDSLGNIKGSYPAGTAFDPISLAVDLKEAEGPDPTEPGAVGGGKKKQRIDADDLRVDLAQIECLVATCTVDAPKKVTAEIKGGPNAGKKVKAKVKAPETLSEGGVKTVTAKFKKSAAKLLGDGGKLKLAAEITVTGGGETASEDVKVTVAG